MKDRVPKYPGKVLIAPEDGSAPFYATLTRADEPVEEGTALNKGTLLNIDAENALGFADDSDPTISDAFIRVSKNIKNYQSTFQKLMTGRFV